MNWSDYESVWKRQPLPAGNAVDLAELKRTFEDEHRKLAATHRMGKMVEACAGVMAVAAFVRGAWHLRNFPWLIGIAAGPILSVIGLLVWDYARTRRWNPGPAASLRAKLEADFAELQHQVRLRRNVWKWSLGLLAVAIIIIFLMVQVNRPPPGPVRDAVSYRSYGEFLTPLLWCVWALNRRTARKQIEPRLEELEKLRRDILSIT